MLPIANHYWHRAFTDPWSARATSGSAQVGPGGRHRWGVRVQVGREPARQKAREGYPSHYTSLVAWKATWNITKHLFFQSTLFQDICKSRKFLSIFSKTRHVLNFWTTKGSTLSFLAGCPESHLLGWYRNFLVYWYLKLDNQVVNLTCPNDKLGWIWRADDL